MTKRRTTLALAAGVLCTVSLIACGSERAAAPTAPAALALPMAAAEMPFEAAINGGRMTAQSSTTEATALTVSSVVSGTACPTLQFMIGPYVIKTDAATVYSGGSCADIKTGTKLGLIGSLSSDLVFNATKVTLQSTTTTTPPKEKLPVSGESEVTSIVGTTSCPTLSFFLGPYKITTSSETVYEGGTCASIKVGARLRLTGTKTELTIEATKVEFKEAEEEEPTSEHVEGEGIISSLTAGTSCPALGFTIGTYKIALDATTVFDSGACADLKAGLRVHVKGTINAAGTVAASRIIIQHEAPHPEAEGEGVVTAMVTGSSCPAIKFMVGEYTVEADASTEFPAGSCTAIEVGTRVNVKGSMTDAKTVAAKRIIVQK